MEMEKRIPSIALSESELNFELLNIDYEPRAYVETYPMEDKYKLFAKGYVDLSTQQAVEDVRIEFEEADTGARTQWKTRIKHKTYAPREVAEVNRPGNPGGSKA